MSPEQIRVPLDDCNTFGLPATAARYQRIDDVGNLIALARAGALRGPRLVLGGGSNLVFTGDVDALVLHVALRGRERLTDVDDAWRVAAAGGEPWHDFVRWTLDQELPGLENLSLIPGTVGAAPIQNIGAYGLEMAERFESLDAVDLDTGDVRQFTAADCRFGYRDSVFKQAEAGRWLITRVIFRLPRPWPPLTGYADLQRHLAEQGIATPTARQISDAVIAVRQAKLPDPAVLGNAGSFFKNPIVSAPEAERLLAAHPGAPHYPQADGRIKLAAGWLIDQCGWKGRRLGPVGCHARQALVIVNHGGATGTDVKRLAEAVAADVQARFGIALEAEPSFV
ncbi:UDP-N-acetylmuramate dehydrogenase [Denitromonas iodatirespirans]|uniref:UDP-N-acetylenolpyruvoylglucosamine reductase n=1 Tax=Denitromonas iodatirespirans TaxID=2795389 RepID=A0A944H766_DENI1|nr:UDP-N-acetylmuramate dehydrogenase [Denitromonas iodatirespirans]MBT0959995.1 UDP-N-acetylmuramate dehydrogenase [Denitromonas iodatirespirans]